MSLYPVTEESTLARCLVFELIPIIVREMSRDEAVIEMVDSNLPRESILLSEKVFAYKMKMDAMRRKAGRPSKENCVPMAHNFEPKKTRSLSQKKMERVPIKFVRYIRLTELVPELLEMVDTNKIAFRPAV